MRRIAPLIAALVLAASTGAAEHPLTVFAAASLSDALRVAAGVYATETGDAPRFSFDASGTLARQIERGAPADLFISASAEWMDHLAERGLVVKESRETLARNRLVVVAPHERAADFRDVASLARAGRIAIGDPATVPAGRYAMQALAAHAVPHFSPDRIVHASNVRAALALAERGEVDAAIVYATDARASIAVTQVLEFAAADHDPIVIEAAIVRECPRPAAARRFLWTLHTPAARAAFTAAGFETDGD